MTPVKRHTKTDPLNWQRRAAIAGEILTPDHHDRRQTHESEKLLTDAAGRIETMQIKPTAQPTAQWWCGVHTQQVRTNSSDVEEVSLIEWRRNTTERARTEKPSCLSDESVWSSTPVSPLTAIMGIFPLVSVYMSETHAVESSFKGRPLNPPVSVLKQLFRVSGL